MILISKNLMAIICGQFLTGDKRVASSRLTGFTKYGFNPGRQEIVPALQKIVDWNLKHQNKQAKIMAASVYGLLGIGKLLKYFFSVTADQNSK